MRWLAGEAANQEEQGKSKSEPPEPGRDRPDVRQAYEPRPERQCDIANEERREGERMGMRFVAGQIFSVTSALSRVSCFVDPAQEEDAVPVKPGARDQGAYRVRRS